MAVLCDPFVFLQRDQKLLKTKNGDHQKRPKRAKERERDLMSSRSTTGPAILKVGAKKPM